MNKRSRYHFHLGAPDPEMDFIEDILKLLQIPYTYAMYRGARVHHCDAYRAEHVPAREIGRRTLVFVECAVRRQPPDILIDHHNPGDAGHSLGPEHFWEASSVGQLFALLELAPTDNAKLIAAADHCYAAAVRGKCPGIEPYKVRKLKREGMYKHEHPNMDHGLIQRYVDRLQRSPQIVLADERVVFLPEDLGRGHAPEYIAAQYAATELGVPVILRNHMPHSRQQRLHLCGPLEPFTVKYFMQFWAPRHELVRVYGAPMRGYAGGYLEYLFDLDLFLEDSK